MTENKQKINKSRRRFIKLSVLGGGGLTLGLYIGVGSERARTGRELWLDGPEGWTPNAWLRIDREGIVTVRVNHTELGQGVTTGLPTILADELEADWSKVRFETAPVEPAYDNPMMGSYMTAGSTSTPGSWEPLRAAGAAAREMLILAAAVNWGVAANECRAENGAVLHPASSRRLTYGELADAAAEFDPPSDVVLKDPKAFRLIGTDVPRLDIEDKVAGRAIFAIDHELPGMLTATVLHPPVFGERLAGFAPESARAMPGVRDVLAISDRRAIAVVADTYWQAARAAAALEVEWEASGDRELSSESIWQRWSELLDSPDAKELAADGDVDVDAAIAGAAKSIESEYRVPYQAHATAEPPTCVAQVEPSRCRIWTGTQGQSAVKELAAKLTGLGYADIEISTLFAGGGFGRRAGIQEASEAIELAQKTGAPVKVIWNRQEEIRNDPYRPASLHRLRAGLDERGQVIAWSHRIVGPDPMVALLPPLMGSALPYAFPRGLRNLTAGALEEILPSVLAGVGVRGGASPLAYRIESFRLDYVQDTPPVPVGIWRAVAYSVNPFVVESFIDELAAASGRDPVAFRRELAKDSPRPLAALERAAKEAGWGTPTPAGIYRGVALADYDDAWVAMVAEVSVAQGQVRVQRVVCAVDCGRVINPRNVRAQIAGGLAFGLTATLKGEITLREGRVQQSNLDDFPLLTIAEMPEVEVHLIASNEPPLGIGELGVTAIAPAVANAVSTAVGKRIRKLPITLG